MPRRPIAVCLMLLFAAPLWAVENAATPYADAPDVVLDEATFALLEQQLATLDQVIALQEERLAEFEGKMLLETDPVRQGQLDRLALRLTRLLDELEYRRDDLRTQLQAIREIAGN